MEDGGPDRIMGGLGRGQEADQEGDIASSQRRGTCSPRGRYTLVRRGRTCGSGLPSFNPNMHFWALSGKHVKRFSHEEADFAPWRPGSAAWGLKFARQRPARPSLLREPLGANGPKSQPLCPAPWRCRPTPD